MKKEKGKTWEKSKRLFVCGFSFFVFPFSFLQGCASDKPTTRPTGARERQDAALADPFGYSPHDDPADISGGKIGELNRDAMKKDIDHVFNP